MKTGMFIAVACLSFGFAFDVCAAQTVDDDEYEEIVIRRKVKKNKAKKPKKKAPPVVAPAPVATNAVVAAQPPPPPEPPAEEASEPRRLVHYFCKCWKDEDYERLWWAMTPQYRKGTPLNKFTKLFEEDKESNGGVVDENIVIDDVQLGDGGIQVTVDLRYKFKRAGVRRVKAIVDKKGTVYRMRDSGIIPIDMNDL